MVSLYFALDKRFLVLFQRCMRYIYIRVLKFFFGFEKKTHVVLAYSARVGVYVKIISIGEKHLVEKGLDGRQLRQKTLLPKSYFPVTRRFIVFTKTVIIKNHVVVTIIRRPICILHSFELMLST